MQKRSPEKISKMSDHEINFAFERLENHSVVDVENYLIKLLEREPELKDSIREKIKNRECSNGRERYIGVRLEKYFEEKAIQDANKTTQIANLSVLKKDIRSEQIKKMGEEQQRKHEQNLVHELFLSRIRKNTIHYLSGLDRKDRVLIADANELVETKKFLEDTMTSDDVKDFLGCSAAELNRWSQDGRINPSQTIKTYNSNREKLSFWYLKDIERVTKKISTWRHMDRAAQARKAARVAQVSETSSLNSKELQPKEETQEIDVQPKVFKPVDLSILSTKKRKL